MQFTSIKFLLFFPAVCLIYFFFPKKAKVYFLVAASYLFYINSVPVYALLLLTNTIITYFAAYLIESSSDDRKRRGLLISTITLSVLTLGFFKYYSFINETTFSILTWLGFRWSFPEIKLLLPIGISYYTFQTIGYLFDVYNRSIKAERTFKYYLLFVSFFPTIVSGPIERAKNMIPQFKNTSSFLYRNASQGLKLMLWGYFMKLVVADGLCEYIDEIYRNAQNHGGKTLLLVSLLYPMQLYCDFNGYSTIAIGVAKILGFDVIQNFRRPYLFSTSITNFWRRNHISLTTWLTNYIYTPLTIRYRDWGTTGLVASIILTFLIAGIWHGAGWTFVIYGLIHGTVLSFDAVNQKRRNKFEKKWGLKDRWWYIGFTCLVTYLIVCFTFIFFRSNSLYTATSFTHRIFTESGILYLGSSSARFGFSILTLAMVVLSDFRDEYHQSKLLLYDNKLRIIRWTSYLVTLFLLLLLGNFGSDKFIYFQF
jgi:D-alanyl-lipoteichoic acid acyltransferase DltB (MBOAT superfamily)